MMRFQLEIIGKLSNYNSHAMYQKYGDDTDSHRVPALTRAQELVLQRTP